MNQLNGANFPEPSSNDSTLANNDEQLIEAEIVENEPFSATNPHKYPQNSSSRRPKGNNVVSIVHQPQQIHRGIFIPLSDDILEGDYIEVAHRTTSSTIERNRLESLITPWTIASMLMLLTANILLSISQWHYSSQLAAQKNLLENGTASIETPQISSISRNVNLAAEKSDRLDVEVLSLAQGSPATTQTSVSVARVQATTTTKPAPNLTQALLPPAPQPQPNIQSYSVPATLPVANSSIPAPQQPPTPIAAPPAPAPRQFPFPPPPMAQVPPLAPPSQPLPPAQPVTQTVPAPSNTAPIAEFSKRHVAEQQRAEAANRPVPTLYQKTRVEGLAREYQLDPNKLTQQVQQLQSQPTTNVQQSIQNQLPPSPNNLSRPSNEKPSIERKSDGSIEIRSNNLR